MSETSEKSKPMTSKDSRNATSSPASECGVTPCASPDGPMTDLFGREAVLALRSASLERKRTARSAKAATLCRALDELATSYAADAATHGLPMPATYGRRCGDLSAVDAQYACLVSRLREATEKFGSRLFVLRWKSLDTVFGLRASMLRALGRPTSGSDCISWQTPQMIDEGNSRPPRLKPDNPNRDPNTAGSYRGDLKDWAQLAAWPTPQAFDAKPCEKSDEAMSKAMAGRAIPGRHGGPPANLRERAKLASWATPRSVESGHSTGNPNRAEDQKSRLEDQVFLASPQSRVASPDPLTASGETSNGSGAATGSIGQLNPAHSRWLMGCRLAWQECNPKFEDWRKWQGFLTTLSNGQRVFGSAPCAAMVTHSARRSRKGSSKPIWNRRKLNADG